MLSRRRFFGIFAAVGGYVVTCGYCGSRAAAADHNCVSCGGPLPPGKPDPIGEEVWIRLVPVTQPAGVLAPRDVLFTEWPTTDLETLDLRATDQTWGPFGFDIPDLWVKQLEYHLPETFFNKVHRVPIKLSHALYLDGRNTLTLQGLRLVMHF